jgi:hypothetical protein
MFDFEMRISYLLGKTNNIDQFPTPSAAALTVWASPWVA